MPFPDAGSSGPNIEDIRITDPAKFATFIHIAPAPWSAHCFATRRWDASLSVGTDGPKTLDPDRLRYATEADHPLT